MIGFYLPKDELNKMYLNIGQGNTLGLSNIGNFADANYWCSSEINNNYSVAQYFYYGNQNSYNKNSYYNVRAFRSFSSIVKINDDQISRKHKNLIKIFNVIGRESKPLKNQPHFYFYDDGSVEKKFILK